jgi:hypothetical protein
VRELSRSERSTVQAVAAAVQQALGLPLPERGFRGGRGALLASLSPAAVKERVGRWVGCCGADFTRQLVSKEPTLLALEPDVLLATLEALNRHMELAPQARRVLRVQQPASSAVHACACAPTWADAAGC